MVLSLASLNLHCGLDHRGAPYSVKAAVAALDTDVIVVQENWRARGTESLAASAAADCGYPCFAELDMVPDAPLADLDVVDGAAPDEVGAWGLAVMSRVPWVSTTAIGIGTAPGDVVGARSAQVIELPGLRVVNVHLTHRLLHGPAQLRRLLAGLRSSRVPTLIAGDLNMCRPTVYLARGYRPAVRGRTWPAQRPVAQLDHVLLGAGVMATGAEVGPNLGSDHLPVRLTIQ
ncbi:endonuclease/exonuclease/phosphatase family protein [Amorphoplanes digitatis]|uniref:Endonuclease/exonuclease/phosphatase family metal-dependent hydrolase n=1 Tax=Actinoplanes digitatis TaxID=1868 RepID=A0A7W7HVC6_9ACTN|nr:endonuclease/exonuclease/phosphatase family protein [Actinoplanes digitatis]MBB4761457.1 endonuclease/exonuclease/phosphatase family metal-dependent hydrolase [Actinoplanes digitatis]GID97697.1 hypothetical protein Adi01nite_71090 [Actinoplanes digitatis]